MDKRVDNIVANSETIEKATGLYVFSWIRESYARDYCLHYLSEPKQNSETGLYIWPYEPSVSCEKQAQVYKDKSEAFVSSVLAELSSSGYVLFDWEIFNLTFYAILIIFI